MRSKFLKIGVIFSLFFCLATIAKAAFLQADTLKLGDKISDFTLPNTVPNQPKIVSLKDYHNKKGVVIIFMTNGCYHCIQYRERIKNLNTQFANKGFPIITINPSNPSYAFEETREEMMKNAIKENYAFPYLQDSTQEVTKNFEVKTTPTAYILLKKANNWILKYKGEIDNDMENKKKKKITFVENELKALINGVQTPLYQIKD